MSSKNQITGGAFQDVEGNLLANGYLTMKLSQDAVIASSGQICGSQRITVPLDANGNITGTISVWPNDVLVPAGTFYTVTAYASSGQQAWGPQAVQVLSTPSPFVVSNWVPLSGTTQNTATLAQTGSLNVLDFGAKCDGVTDDTAAVNAAMAAAGSLLNPTMLTWPSTAPGGNLSPLIAFQKRLVFPSGRITVITSTIEVSPGVLVDLNNSTVKMTGTGTAFAIEQNGSGTYGYGNDRCGIINGNIIGPGSATSTGRGIFLNISAWNYFENLYIAGFKFGITAWETQYTYFGHVYCINNKVGFYLTARPTNTTLAALDNTFVDVVADCNDKYGIWAQCLSSSSFTRVDASRNGSADIVLGAQLGPYISSYTVNSGGSGYALNATIPCTITDAGGGLNAQAYAVTNGSGNVTAVYGVDGGRLYVTPVVTVPGGSVAASVTANITNDAGLGDWNGVSSIQRGSVSFDTVKIEHVRGVDGPDCGYGIVINGTGTGAIRDVKFDAVQFQRQIGGGRDPYYRLAFNQGFGNVFTFCGDSSGVPDSMSNPAVSGDVSIFRNVTSQGLTTLYANFQGAVLKYVVDESNIVEYGGFRASTLGFTGDGKVLAFGYHSTSSFSGAAAEESDVAGDANFRFQRNIDGKLQWGPGTTALDTNLYRDGTNSLKTDGGLHAVGVIQSDNQLRCAAFYGTAGGGHAVDFYTANDGGQFEMNTTAFIPFTDVTKTLGDATHRFTDLYATAVATPLALKNQTIGIGNGAGTNLTAPAKSTGSGPASLVAVQWEQVTVNGSTYWIPLYQ